MNSRSALKGKCIFAVLLPCVFYTLTYLIDYSFFVIFMAGTGFAYLIPFYVNAYYIKQSPAEADLKHCIFCDAVFVLMPAVVSAVIGQAILCIFGIAQPSEALLCAALCIAFVLFTLIEWLTYPIIKWKAQRIK